MTTIADRCACHTATTTLSWAQECNKRVLFTWLLVVVMLVQVGIAQAEFELATGFDWSSGAYGGEIATTMSYIPLTLRYDSERWRAKVTLPWLQIRGPATAVVTDGGVVSTDSGAQGEESASGAGDLTLGLTHKLPALGGGHNHFVDIGLTLKLPTADADQGLGSGATDLSMQIDYTLATQGWMPFASLGYKRFGQPEGYALNPVWYTSLGLQYPIGNGRAVGMIWDGRQASTDSGTARSEAMLYLSHRWAQRFKLTWYGVTGFTSSSVDQEAGFQLSVAIE